MTIFLLAALFLTFSLAVFAQLGKEAPMLPPPHGNVQVVKDAAQLKRAVEGAGNNSTVLIADGAYKLDSFMYMRGKKNVTIRGASGDPTKVVISAKGWDSEDVQDDILRIGDCEDITVAHVTFTDCHAYAVKVQAESFPKNINIYNCHFKNIGIRAIKGSTSLEGSASGGSIRHCRFENTKIPPAHWQFGGNYITAIDMMALDGWVISDNYFKDIKGRTGNARGAIFVWVRSKNVTVERNVIINCDRGVSFGNPSGSTAFREGAEHITDSLVRNNFIVPGPDAGIELWWAKNVKVYNNTIWREDTGGPGLRGGSDQWKITNIDVANNLVRGANALSGGVTLRNNLFAGLAGYFVDAKSGDLHLTSLATNAIGKAIALPDVTDDFDGCPRDAAPDIGACEFGAREARLAAKAVRGDKTQAKPKDDVPLEPKKLIAAQREALHSTAVLLANGDTDGAKKGYEEVAAKLPEGPVRDAVALLASSCGSLEQLTKTVITGVAAQGPKKVFVDFAGSVLQASLSDADANGIVLRSVSGPIVVEWSAVAAKRVADMARKYAASVEDKTTVLKYLAACGEFEAAAELLAELRSAGLQGDPLKAADLIELILP